MRSLPTLCKARIKGASSLWQAHVGVYQPELASYEEGVPGDALGSYLTMRYAMLDLLGQDYVRTARMKGVTRFCLSQRSIFLNLGFLVGGQRSSKRFSPTPGSARSSIRHP